MSRPGLRLLTLAQRLIELQTLRLGQPQHRFTRDKLLYDFTMAPPGGRFYRCRIVLHRDGSAPTFLVLSPDLTGLAKERALPHIYPHDGPGTRLCLWLPSSGEWTPCSRLRETLIPWAIEWLSYFENWLVTDEWNGGGVHRGVYSDWERACVES